MTEKSRDKTDILVVYKKTSYERWRADGDPRIEELLLSGDASVEKLRSAHDAHLDTMNRARAALKSFGTKAVFRHKHAERPSEHWDLVVTLGGDGTQDAAIGTRTGPGLSADEIIPAVERIVYAYLELREGPQETFLQAYRRVGMEPFKTALYEKAEAYAAE